MRAQSPGPHPPAGSRSAIHRPGGTINVEGVPSPSMPVLTPQVSLPNSSVKPHDTSLQNTYLDTLSKSQISDPKKSRLREIPNVGSPAGNMPMLSPTTGILHSPSPLSDRGTGSPLPLSNAVVQSHVTNNKQSVIQLSAGSFGVMQQAPRTESQPLAVNPANPVASMTGPPNVTVQASVAQPNMGLGGAGSQIRALQNLPPNTRLVRAPNGQVTLQKIQTIELTPEMQQVRIRINNN